jgi:RNA polymerase sigma-70 factor (ECF subfamily)
MNNLQIIEYYYQNHQAELLAFVSSRLGGKEEAEDIVQDVFLRLLQYSNPIMETTLQALAYTIARNLLNDLYRRKQWAVRHGMQPIDCKQQPVTSDDETARPLSVQEVTEFLERGLLRVPEKCRELYRMHIYDGMQVSDISQQTGENYKSVEYRLGVARKEIRKYLRHIS